MEYHLDELVAAVAVLIAQDGVDATRIVGLGNSKGCLHVLRTCSFRCCSMIGQTCGGIATSRTPASDFVGPMTAPPLGKITAR